MNPIAISVENLGKCYHIYDQPVDRLKQSLWRNRKKFYREFWALKNITLTIGRGETLGIVGSNGSGKSTLLQMICGTLWPTVGRVSVNGRIAALLELGAGFNPEFTGRENVYMNAAVMGLSKAEIDQRFESIEKFADIGEFIENPVKVYSSGMYLRLAFATAVHVSADILVVDEALSVGDARFQQKCMARIRDFCDNGTALFVTHNSSAVTELCSRAIWIENGQILMDDSPKKVMEKYMQFMYEAKNAFPKAKEKTCAEQSCLKSDFSTSGFIRVHDGIRQFGSRAVEIVGAKLVSDSNTNGVAYGGKPCEISVLLKANKSVQKPIVGYIVKDPLGREIMGDNTALLKESLAPLYAGMSYVVTFQLCPWPNLLEDDYSLTVAVADGLLQEHCQCHFIYDILIFKSIPVRKPSGLFSVADTRVSLIGVEKQNGS